MAEVRLGDVVIQTPQFDSYVTQRILDTNAFNNSGVIVTNPTLDAHVKSGLGQTINMPHFNPINTADEPNISTDDPGSSAVPKKIGTGQITARKLMLNQHWASMDLVPAMNGNVDPVAVIANQIADYWSVIYSKYLISAAVGVLADNEANDSGDMLAGDGLSPMDADLIIDAKQTAGDRQTIFGAIAMHSQVYSNLQKAQLITFVKPNESTSFAVYNDLLVVVDDALPVTGAGPFVYTSVIFGAGSFMLGNGSAKVPFNVSREELVGDGEGEELVHSRRHFALHPNGFTFSGTPAAQSATRAELEAATAWDRVYDRKRINMAFIKSNG